jgi:hypothetical protein
MAEVKDIQISEDLKDLVTERLDLLSPELVVSIGSSGTFTKGELIDHVRKGDEVGKTIIKMEINFLKALKNGTLLDELLSDKNEN